MKSWCLRALPALTAPLLLAACVADLPLTTKQTRVETRPMKADGTFSLRNVNGSVTVATWSEPEVRIEYEKAASSSGALDRIEVRIEGEGDRIAVSTRHPKGSFFGSKGAVKYRITLPATARLDLESVNGAVHVADAAGRVRATTVNGSVELEGPMSDVEAQTVNGSIRATCSKSESTALRSFRTTNGSIRVRLPEDVSGDFEAKTVNGGIHTDFPITVSGRFGPKSLRGHIGSGGGEYRLATVNGAVRIERI
jgi:hypothetical protein